MEEYIDLLSKNYNECCEYLLNKYGIAEDDYFSKPSYKRFKNGEIKAPGKKKISRTDEGLYIHHMDEDKQILIAEPNAILKFDIPFAYQEKDRLVYCNLIEHGILHILIAIKDVEEGTRGEGFQAHGIGGYVNFIRPQLVQWLIKEVEPKLPWQINCKNVIVMPINYAEMLIDRMDNFLVESYPISQEEIDEAEMAWFRRYGNN